MKRIDGINVIPFIDIMLVLLAIVLTTATFIAEERLEIQLPESAARDDTPAAPETVELAIDRDGRLFIGGAPTTPDDLKNRLSALSPDTPVVLRVDQDTRFAKFVTVVDLLKIRGMDRLTILTRKSAI